MERKYHVFGVDSLLFHSGHFHSAYVIISADRGWRLRAPDSSVCDARCLCNCTGGVTGPEGREGTNEVGGGNGDGNWIGGRNGDVNGDGNRDRVEPREGMEASERAQDGNGDRRGGRNGNGGGDQRTNPRWERERQRRRKREQ